MKTQTDIPERFRVARATLRVDRLMTWVIKSGGVLIVLAVFGIFFFILAETLPLFSSATLNEEGGLSRPLPAGRTLMACTPEGNPVVYDGGRGVETIDARTGAVRVAELGLPDDFHPSAHRYLAARNLLLLASPDGRAALVPLSPVADASGGLRPGEPVFMHLDQDGGSVGVPVAVDYASSGDAAVLGAIVESEGRRTLRLVYLEISSSLMGESSEEPVAWHDAGHVLPGVPSALLVGGDARSVVVGLAGGPLACLEVDADGVACRQTIESPLPEGEKIASLCWVFGGSTLIAGGDRGSLRGFARFWHELPGGGRALLFGETKTYDPSPGAIDLLVPSARNKSFLAVGGGRARLFFNTSAEERLNVALDFRAAAIAASPGFDRIAFLDTDNRLRRASLDDPFPEASPTALFGKIWYEGYPAPAWEWQSSAANEDAEAKLSLTTLVFGTLKGTLYAMLFATPLALGAAIYTAHYMPVGVKRVVKPLMETMASLPSVVLGFFGALYLAPRLEDKAPALLLIAAALPALAFACGFFWSRVPASLRNRFRGGLEYLVLLPATALGAWLAWTYAAPFAERVAVLCGEGLGALCGHPFEASSFREMWEDGFGLPYEQRNALVVGIVMGFAVIPVIFTIAEDALSAVPTGLIAASDAMGASRWQTMRMVILPVAAAGIFSALMMGLGRAVGETMIVLMATGNTPVMDWNIMNGMRTLSANIATELPEAVAHSGHYRVLFLSALLLFVITFALNTAAEMLRRRLRRRFSVGS